MENTYQQALAFYNRNDYERALDILEQCEPSAQTIALKNGCITGLKAQYKYLIDESIKMGNTASVEEYASKYKRYIGEDSYIESITHAATNRSNLASSEENESQPWYDQEVAGMELKYILVVLAIVVLVVVLYLNFGGHNNKVEQAPAEDTVTIAYDESVSADGTTEDTYDTSQQTDYVEDEVEDSYEDETFENKDNYSGYYDGMMTNSGKDYPMAIELKDNGDGTFSGTYYNKAYNVVLDLVGKGDHEEIILHATDSRGVGNGTFQMSIYGDSADGVYTSPKGSQCNFHLSK